MTKTKLNLGKQTIKRLGAVRSGVRAGGGTFGQDSEFCTHRECRTIDCDGGAGSKPPVR